MQRGDESLGTAANFVVVFLSALSAGVVLAEVSIVRVGVRTDSDSGNTDGRHVRGRGRVLTVCSKRRRRLGTYYERFARAQLHLIDEMRA